VPPQSPLQGLEHPTPCSLLYPPCLQKSLFRPCSMHPPLSLLVPSLSSPVPHVSAAPTFFPRPPSRSPLCASVSPVPSHPSRLFLARSLRLCVSAVIPPPSTRFTPLGRGHARCPLGCVWRAWTATSGLRIPVSQQTFRPRAAHNAAPCVRRVGIGGSRGAHTYAGNPAFGGCPRASHDRARGRCPPPPRGVHALHTTSDVDIAGDAMRGCTPTPHAAPRVSTRMIARHLALFARYHPAHTRTALLFAAYSRSFRPISRSFSVSLHRCGPCPPSPAPRRPRASHRSRMDIAGGVSGWAGGVGCR